MRIFGKVLQNFRFPKRPLNCCKPRRFFSIVCNHAFGRRLLPNCRARNEDTRFCASESGPPTEKGTSVNENTSMEILPVGMISNKKLMFIPIQLFGGDDDATRKTLNTLAIIRDHASELEAFSNSLLETKLSFEYSSSAHNRKSVSEKLVSQDDLALVRSYDDSYEELERLMAEEEKDRIEVHDFYDVAAWNSSLQQLVYNVPDNLEEKLKQMSISSVQLSFEMDMSNIKDAILMSALTKDINLFKPPTKKSLKTPTITMTSSVDLSPDEKDNRIPLAFNALIQGTVEIDPSIYTPSNVGNVDALNFNDSVTAIAANICCAALQKGFSVDMNRKPFASRSLLESSTKKKANINSPHGKRSSQLGTPAITRNLTKYTGSDRAKNTKKPKSKVRTEISLLSTSAIISDYGPRGLMSCKVYARALEEAEKRRAALAERAYSAETPEDTEETEDNYASDYAYERRKTMSKTLCPGKDAEAVEDISKRRVAIATAISAAKEEILAKKKSKYPCGSALDSPCNRKNYDECGNEIKSTCKTSKKKKKQKKKKCYDDPCKKKEKKKKDDPCKKKKASGLDEPVPILADSNRPFFDMEDSEIPSLELADSEIPCLEIQNLFEPAALLAASKGPCSGGNNPCGGKKNKKKKKDPCGSRKDPCGGSKKKKGRCDSDTDACKIRQKQREDRCRKPKPKRKKCILEDPCKIDPCKKKQEDACKDTQKKCSSVYEEMREVYFDGTLFKMSEFDSIGASAHRKPTSPNCPEKSDENEMEFMSASDSQQADYYTLLEKHTSPECDENDTYSECPHMAASEETFAYSKQKNMKNSDYQCTTLRKPTSPNCPKKDKQDLTWGISKQSYKKSSEIRYTPSKRSISKSSPTRDASSDSKNSKSPSKAKSEHIVCVRKGDKGCISPGNADNNCGSGSSGASHYKCPELKLSRPKIGAEKSKPAKASGFKCPQLNKESDSKCDSSHKRKFGTSALENKDIIDILPAKTCLSTLSLTSTISCPPQMEDIYEIECKKDDAASSLCNRIKRKNSLKRKNIKKRRKLRTDCFSDDLDQCTKPLCTRKTDKKKENKYSSTSISKPLLHTKNVFPVFLSTKRNFNMDAMSGNRLQCLKDKEKRCEKYDYNSDDKCNQLSPEDNEVVRIKEPCCVQRVSEAVPNFSDYDVLIRTETVALSGSDLHYYETGGKSYPGITLGHDATGVVEKVGKCISTLKPGDCVAIESGLSCGICDYCKRGCYNCCTQLIFNGFLRKFQVHPADLCHKIPPTVDIDEAALTQTLATGCQACFRSKATPTTNMLIIGSCPTAVAAGLCARAIGVKNICIASSLSEPLEAIEQNFYFNCVYYEHDMQYSLILECLFSALHGWPDAVINCAVSEKTLNLSVMALKPCGLCVLAECDAECAGFNAMDVLMKNLKILPSFRSINMFPTALNLIESGRAPIGKLIARKFGWHQMDLAFRAALHESNVGNRKVIVNCTEEENSKERTKI